MKITNLCLLNLQMETEGKISESRFTITSEEQECGLNYQAVVCVHFNKSALHVWDGRQSEQLQDLELELPAGPGRSKSARSLAQSYHGVRHH